MKRERAVFWALGKKLLGDGLRLKDVTAGIALLRSGKLNANYVAGKEQLNLFDAIAFCLKHRLGIGLRKPFPGFNPVIYSNGNLGQGSNPTLRYLNSGEPSGPWYLQQIPTGDGSTGVSTLSCALHVHVFYPDLLREILESLAINVNKPKIFLTFPSIHSQAVRKTSEEFEFEYKFVPLVENIGRDLGPFLISLPEEFFQEFDVIGHAHTKKSLEFLGGDSGTQWFRFMLNTLIGGKASGRKLDYALREFERNPNLGMVFPDDPNIMGWSQNYEIATEKMPEYELPGPSETFEFPMGSFFMARVDAIRPILQLGIEYTELPQEPVPYDGTLLHAIERLLGLIPKALGFDIMGTHNDGISR